MSVTNEFYLDPMKDLKTVEQVVLTSDEARNAIREYCDANQYVTPKIKLITDDFKRRNYIFSIDYEVNEGGEKTLYMEIGLVWLDMNDMKSKLTKTVKINVTALDYVIRERLDTYSNLLSSELIVTKKGTREMANYIIYFRSRSRQAFHEWVLDTVYEPDAWWHSN